MESSIKVPPKMPETFKAPRGHSSPAELDCKAQLAFVHPLKQSEENIEQHRLNLNLQMLRQYEGLAAPLKLTMELKSASKVGHLPFLPSSNLQRDILLGRDELIDFSDIFGQEEFSEALRQPHAVVEKKLGIL